MPTAKDRMIIPKMINSLFLMIVNNHPYSFNYLQPFPFHSFPYLMPQEAHIAPRIAMATSMATTIMAILHFNFSTSLCHKIFPATAMTKNIDVITINTPFAIAVPKSVRM